MLKDNRPRFSSDPIIRDIESLRGVSILMVLAAHISFLLPWEDAAYRVVAPINFGAGVDLFFVISGFVISASFWRGFDRKKPAKVVFLAFSARRFFRLWPAAAAGIIATSISTYLLSQSPAFSRWGVQSQTPAAALSSLFYVMNYHGYRLVQAREPLTLFAHYWSLALEEQFYLLFPALALALRSPLRMAIVAVAIAVLFVPLARASITDIGWWFRFDGLAVGIILHEARHRGWLSLPSSLSYVLAAIGLAGILLSRILLGDTILASTATVLCAGALVGVAAQNQNLFQWTSARPMVALGARSYTIYIWHLLIFSVTKVVWLQLGAGREFSLIATLSIIACLLPSTLLIEALYKWVELPSRKIGKAASARIMQ